MAQDELCLAGEEWRDVAGYEGLYQVSNLGRVKSLERYVPFGNHGICHHEEKIMGQHPNGRGYLHVMLSKDGKKTNKYVHRLVAEAFVANPDGLKYVDHIDGVRDNNVASNLRYCTQFQNIHYSIDAGRMSLEENARHIQTDEAKKAQRNSARRPVMRSDGVMFESMKAAAAALGCTKTAISNAVRGITKTCKGYTFTYV